MNPPQALLGAMSRDRKPFTYTPGGLDLSEIKSERMAKRLMRNAMNQGVPELPQSVQSPPTPSMPIAVPNYNCLPVQVFPAFNLPANPKSLLRTRSTPDQHREPSQPPSQNVNNLKRNGAEQLHDIIDNNPQQQSQTIQNYTNNNIPVKSYDKNKTPIIDSNTSTTMYGSDSYTAPILPEISYEAEYFHAIPRVDDSTGTSSNCFSVTNDNEITKPVTVNKTSENIKNDITIEPSESVSVPIFETKTADDNAGTDDDEKREVKITKKQQVKKESKTETQNGDHNGDVNTEAEMTVKIPAMKSAAKTETKVEVSTKTLPDGSIEETKVTTTRTTIDGRTEIKTKTERKIIPKALEIEEEEEEEEEEENGDVIVKEVDDNGKEVSDDTAVVQKSETQNAKQADNVVKKEERSESTTTSTKKVVVVQQSTKSKENDEEEEEEEEEGEVKPAQKPQTVSETESKKDEEEDEVEVEEEIVEKKKIEIKSKEAEEEEEEDEEEEEEEETEDEKKESKTETKKENDAEEDEKELDEAEELEKKSESKIKQQQELVQKEQDKKEEDDESEYTEEEYESEKEETIQTAQETKPKEEEKPNQEAVKENQEQSQQQTETKIPLREPSIPLEKVEDVEIKPIGLQTLSKTHTESTEIVTNACEKPAGMQSTQTEYNRIENIVTVNRTTKTLDHTYEQLTQQGLPTVKTYFAPEREKVSTSPQPARPYQPAYQPPPQPERRHSLLLERISMERQMPSEIYQNINHQSYEQQRQWSQEPQSEVVNVSNVKPSTITNQEWFQQSRKENLIYNNVLPSSGATPSQQWTQPQPQRQSQPQSYVQPQQQSYEQPQQQSYSQPQSQPQYQQPSYVDNNLQNISKLTSNTYQQNTYTDYSPQPSSWAPHYGASLPSGNTPSNQYSYLNKDSAETYPKTQQYSSSYVPPPWEQDPNYVAPDLPTQNYYQSPPSTNTFSPGAQPVWTSAQPSNKFTKPPPKAYIPPAPNQSFVKPVNTETPPKMPGRKTYYSEYERRYISVPESTYIPGETKHQPQPDPSPQYYYDNNESSEKVEHQWRKELREFTEKSTQSQQTDQSCVRPPWEDKAKYVKAQAYQPTPSWSQTLKPQTWRERSFESEYVGSKTNTQTLGRSRPLSSYGTSNIESSLPERPRGMSVDRYNPSSYQAPLAAEHAPVQTHIHNPQAKSYHNPNVPAYHSRSSAEPREQPVPIPQARHWADSRATPIQSRSFKYLQWITGTED